MYGVVTSVPAPVDTYDRMHAELIRQAGPELDGFGLLVHVGRETADGFEVFEVWESQEHYERAMELVASLTEGNAGAAPPSSADQTAQVFEVHGLVVPGAGILV